MTDERNTTATRRYHQKRNCMDHIHRALVAEMHKRPDADGLPWIDNERQAVAIAANDWAQAHAVGRHVTVEGVERIEMMAVGHYDYGTKLALYVAEFVCAPSDS